MEFFDPSVFSISKAEAESMSPLQRVLLECSYLALLDAGYAADEMKGLNCGVFVGTSAAQVHLKGHQTLAEVATRARCTVLQELRHLLPRGAFLTCSTSKAQMLCMTRHAHLHW